jgi:hypothetical protein
MTTTMQQNKTSNFHQYYKKSKKKIFELPGSAQDSSLLFALNLIQQLSSFALSHIYMLHDNTSYAFHRLLPLLTRSIVNKEISTNY